MAATSPIPLMHLSVMCLTFSILGCVLCDNQCSKKNINHCLRHINSFDTEINSAVVVYLDEETLREHCRLYELFSDCMQPLRPSCSKVDRLVFEGIDDSYEYLCDETFDEYLEYRECLSNTNLHAEGSACNDTLTEKLNRLDTNDYKYARDRICQYAEDYLDCVENAVFSFCGKDAAKWQRGLDERSLKPLLQEIECPGLFRDEWWKASDGSSVMTYIIVALLITVGLIVMFLVVFLTTVYKKRKARREAAARGDTPQVVYGDGQTTILPPPIYPGSVSGLHDNGPGALPNKGPVPPPYDYSYAGAIGGVNPSGDPQAIAPPAYSDITGVHGSSEKGYENPAMLPVTSSTTQNYTPLGENRDNPNSVDENPNPLYDNMANRRGSLGSASAAVYDNASERAASSVAGSGKRLPRKH